MSNTKDDLERALAVAQKSVLVAQEALDKHLASLPPVGTVMHYREGPHPGDVVTVVRLARYYAGGYREPGWLTVFGDGSGSFYPDSEGGLAGFHLDDGEEVYRPAREGGADPLVGYLHATPSRTATPKDIRGPE